MNRRRAVCAGREHHIAPAAGIAFLYGPIDGGRVIGFSISRRAEITHIEGRSFELREWKVRWLAWIGLSRCVDGNGTEEKKN